MDRRNFIRTLAIAGAAMSVKQTEAMTLFNQKVGATAIKMLLIWLLFWAASLWQCFAKP
jgi:hypothetical protein